VTTSKGEIPKDAGNRYFISIEAANSGTGEVWPKAQLETYERLMVGLCEHYGLDPTRDIWTHRSWAPTRKNDPAGPTPARPTWGGPWSPPLVSWPDSAIRESVADASGGPDMAALSPSVRILETRPNQPAAAGPAASRKTPLNAGETITLSAPDSVPASAKSLMISVAVVGVPREPGFLTAWGWGSRPLTSFMNPHRPLEVAWGTTIVPLASDRTFRLYTHRGGHTVVDVSGYGS
jgi:hypothetical protein